MKLNYSKFLTIFCLLAVTVATFQISQKNRILQTETEPETEDTIRAKIDAKI